MEINLVSRVETYYGDSIRRQAEEVLEALGVRHARIHIHDEGALPFVIAARIEAAARRAGLGLGTRVLPDSVPLPAASARDRLRRSRLYVPGSEPKYFINAPLHGSDGIILDLEDSVHSSEKDAARSAGAQCAACRGVSGIANAWCASTSFRSDSKISKRSFRNHPT